MTRNRLLEEIDRRTRDLFAQLAAGDDAPPGTLLRLEGMREAAVMSGLASEHALQALLEEQYLEAFGAPLSGHREADWRTLYPFPQIPAYMKRAPVSSGKGD